MLSVQWVLDWESNSGSIEELEAGVHHETIIVIPEEAPEANHPAAGDSADGVEVDEPVPKVCGEISDHIYF